MAFGFKIKVGLDSSNAERGLAALGRGADRLNRRLGKVAGSALKFGAAIGAATLAFGAFKGIELVKDSSRKAAEFELMGTAFTTLLGSATKAQERLKSLQDFSVVTPFEPEELIRTSKLLQTLAGNTLATGRGLAVVGDAAAVAGAPLEAVALHAGRIFQALTQGGAAGESLARLQELGILGGKAKQEFAELTEAQRKGKAPLLSNVQALESMAKALEKSEGAMNILASTFAGKISTMKGNLGLLKIALGTGINEGLEVGVNAMNEKLPLMQQAATEAGETIGLALGEAFRGNSEALESGAGAVFLKLGEVAAGTFVFAFAKGMTRLLPNVMETIAGVIEETPVLKTTGFAHAKGLRKGAEAFRGMDDGTFQLGDFLDLANDSLGSEEALGEFKKQTELLRESVELQKEKEFLEGRRDIINGEYGPLRYTR